MPRIDLHLNPRQIPRCPICMRELRQPNVHILIATLVCHDCACAYYASPGLISLSAIRAQTEPQDWWTSFGLLVFTPRRERMKNLANRVGIANESAARALARMLRIPVPRADSLERDYDHDDAEPPTSARVHITHAPPHL